MNDPINPRPAVDGRTSRLPVLCTRYSALLFWPALLIWSWLLVKPAPFPEVTRTLSDWGELLPWLVAKCLHLSVYAGLTVAGLLAANGRRWVVLLMAAHGAGTEFGQHLGNEWFDTRRYGCVRDVLIDWAGVAAGAGGWAVWRGRRKKADPRGEPRRVG